MAGHKYFLIQIEISAGDECRVAAARRDAGRRWDRVAAIMNGCLTRLARVAGLARETRT
jgi:hypothetical protein